MTNYRPLQTLVGPTEPCLPDDTLRGLIESLGAVPVRVGDATVALNLTHARQLLATLRRVRTRVAEAARKIEVEAR